MLLVSSMVLIVLITVQSYRLLLQASSDSCPWLVSKVPPWLGIYVQRSVERSLNLKTVPPGLAINKLLQKKGRKEGRRERGGRDGGRMEGRKESQKSLNPTPPRPFGHPAFGKMALVRHARRNVGPCRVEWITCSV